jgi:hypothetical protein
VVVGPVSRPIRSAPGAQEALPLPNRDAAFQQEGISLEGKVAVVTGAGASEAVRSLLSLARQTYGNLG